MESQEFFDMNQAWNSETQPDEQQPSLISFTEEQLPQWDDSFLPSMFLEEQQPIPVPSSDQHFQHGDTIALPPTTYGEIENTSLYASAQSQSIPNYTDAFANLPPSNTLQDFSLVPYFGPETQTWTPEDGQPQWNLPTVHGSSNFHDLPQAISTQMFPSADQDAFGIQQAPMHLLQANVPPMMPTTDSWLFPSANEQNSVESYSTFPMASNLGVAMESIPLDSSLIGLPSQAAHSLPMASPNHMALRMLSPLPQDISSAVSNTTSSLSSQVISQSVTSTAYASIPSTSQNTSPAQSTDRSLKSQIRKRKSKTESPVSVPRRVSKKQNVIPQDMIHCMKFPLPANPELKRSSDGRKQRPCLICQMHKKQVCIYHVPLFVEGLNNGS
jgi:hypothetical protein